MLNINDYGLITAEDVVGQYHAFGPSADTYLESACVDGVCTSSCMATTDSADCGTSCAGGCNITCIGSSNASSVPADCSVCTSTCVGNCSGSCVGGCGDANCEGQCSLTCESMCSVNCDNLCLGTCTGHCYDTCVNGCKDACTGGCDNGCHGCTGCSGGCVSACVDGCKYSCMNVSTAAGTSTISPHMPESISTLRDTGIIQTDTMPEPSAELNNKIYQYIGTSTDNFTNGDFYKCVNTEVNVYVWRNVTDTDVKAMLTDIVRYLNELSQYRYTRISELPESVIIQDGDTFAANATYTDEELSDMHLVISNVDNRTVRVSAASLMNYVLHNYQNNWAWTPVPTVDPDTGAMTVIDWEYQFWENKPQTINLADLVTGGVGRVTDEGDGLMPHEMYTELKEKEVMDISFITGKHRNGETATGVPVLRFNSQDAGAININASFVNDLMETFAQSGDFLTRSVADTLYAAIRSEQDLHSLLRYVMGPDSVDPTEPADLPSDQQLITVNIPALYLTKADAEANYAPKSIASSVETLTLTVGSLQTTVSHFPDTYITSANAALTYVSIANSTTQIPARVPASSNPQSPGTNGLMTPGDVANISTALDDIAHINDQISDIYDIISAYDPAGYATDQRAGIVKVPNTSSIKVASDGAIDLRKYGVNNLIRNSIFSEGFGNAWDDTDIDAASSGVNRDSTIDRDIASIAITADGVLSQEFTSDVRDGFTVGILFKKGSAAKTIEVKIDSANYVSHTVPSGSGYYIAEFYFTGSDNTAINDHTLYIHNPDTSNTVLYEMSEIMVQNGKKFTGWNRNPYDISGVNSINILSYDNYIAFKDRPLTYTEDVYAPDGVTIIHHAGDPINPSSSIIMHKDQQYMYMHITALNQIDGQIRQDVIPLRINLTTGACDISGNAVSAGTLIDNTGELVPTVAQINALIGGTGLELVDVSNEIEVSTMPTADEDLVDNIYVYTGTTTQDFTNGYIYHCVLDNGTYVWEHYSGYARKMKYSLVLNDGTTTTELAKVSHVGIFDNITNGEIFNDYVNNSTTGAFSHVEGFANKDVQPYSHVEGSKNYSGSYTEDSSGYERSMIVTSLPTASSALENVVYLLYDETTHTYERYTVVTNVSTSEKEWSDLGSASLTTGGDAVHVEGKYNISGCTASHVEGTNNIMRASSPAAHIEGNNNIIYEGSPSTHVEGNSNVAYNGINYSHIEGYNNSTGTRSNGSGLNAVHIEGSDNSLAAGMNYTHMEGYGNSISIAGASGGHIEGYLNNVAQLYYGHLEGFKNTTDGSLYGVSIGGLLNTINGGHVGLHVEGKSHIIPAGKSSISMSGTTETITGTDLGGHVEGDQNKLELNPNISNMATGRAYHIEGYNNKITYKDHNNTAKNTGSYLTIGSHVEGSGNSISNGNYIHIEGYSNWVGGDATHIEGGSNKSYNLTYSHIEGQSNTFTPYNNYNASGVHIEGQSNTISGYLNANHIEGQSNSLYGNNGSYANHIEGASNSLGTSGVRNDLSYCHVEGYGNSLEASSTSPLNNITYNHVEGFYNKIKNFISGGSLSVTNTHIEGGYNNVGGSYAHVEGYNNTVNNDANYSHTEGYQNTIYSGAQYVHVEGNRNAVASDINHTEGYYNQNYSYCAHVEGYNNVSGARDPSTGTITTNAQQSHVEGERNTVLNTAAHAEGIGNTVRAVAGHAEGEYNEILSSAHQSHVGGLHNKTTYASSTATGTFNKYDFSDDPYNDIAVDASEITDDTRYTDTYNSDATTSENGVGLSDYITCDMSTVLKFHVIVDSNYANSVVCFYDENKTFIGRTSASVATAGDTSIDFEIDLTNDGVSTNYNKIPKYFRFTSKMTSTDGLNGTYVKQKFVPSLVTIGNGHSETDPNSGDTVECRSNIFEIGRTYVNINGILMQNGEVFKSGTPHFVGTSVEWTALTAEEKAEYEGGDIVFTDDNSGLGIIDNVVTKDSVNPVSSGGVYAALAEITRPTPIKSDNNYYYCRRYYDGRYCVHYRQRFGNTTLTPNTVNKITPASWAGVTSYFSTVIENVFKDNNNIVSMLVIVADKENCRNTFSITSLGYDTANNTPYIYITSQGPDTITDFTVDFVMDTF